MFDSTETLTSATGARLAVRWTMATGRPRAIMLVMHGLAEHSGRYHAFADWLSKRGFHAYAADHRGHGATTAIDAPPRQFARKDGVQAVVRDWQSVRALALSRHGALPVLIFGHSMGGLLALNYAISHSHDMAGLCLWNCNFDVGPQEHLARIALKAEQGLKGSDVASGLLRRATFESWRNSVSPRQTDFDWLSHDRDAVAAYIADPHCGWTATNSMAQNLLQMVMTGGRQKSLACLPAGLPIHLLAGTADPVTEQGGSMQRLAEKLQHCGQKNLTLELISGARHETLNELPAYRDAALQSLGQWLKKATG
ncbi:alpha/beta hydrolase [Aureimonas fodinaquatilis]|uniref:Alpha/beta hydrolase n=1 Tax=Aureimonas fodinaquatilis TaxID=2565783 RepID=A0A5B0E1M4_9HYPH|nr:alpha/beta hydrolase [Aureimonas fodinaquatilis]KAA0972558.1 alpha/beta hydrolase [Aureimonas fodinaquatilis]